MINVTGVFVVLKVKIEHVVIVFRVQDKGVVAAVIPLEIFFFLF